MFAMSHSQELILSLALTLRTANWQSRSKVLAFLALDCSCLHTGNMNNQKLSATEVAISLPGIDPHFLIWLFLNFTVPWNGTLMVPKFLMVLIILVIDNLSVIKVQSQSLSVYVCLIYCCLWRYHCLNICLPSIELAYHPYCFQEYLVLEINEIVLPGPVSQG